MSEKRFSKGEAVQFGWDTVKENVGFFIGLLLILMAIGFVLGFISESVKDIPVLLIPLSIIKLAIDIFVGMGVVRIAIGFCDGTKGDASSFLSNGHLFFKYLAGQVLYGAIVFAGTFLFIVPGVIFAIMFAFCPYLIIDKGMGPIEALKKSAEITKGVKIELFVFGLLLGVINLAGALCLLVGLFATIPLSMVAYAYVYKKLSAQVEPAVPEVTT